MTLPTQHTQETGSVSRMTLPTQHTQETDSVSRMTLPTQHTQATDSVSRMTLPTQHTQETDSVSRMPLPTQHTQETDVHVLSGIRIHNLSNRESANLSHRPHGHRDGVQCLVSCSTGFLVGNSTTVWGGGGVSFRNKVIFMAWPQRTSTVVTRERMAPIIGLTLLGNTFRRVVTLMSHSLTLTVLDSGE
jgi:hypothetical protein